MPLRVTPTRAEDDCCGGCGGWLFHQPRHGPCRQKDLPQPLRLGPVETPFQGQGLATEQARRRVIRESEEPLEPGPHLGRLRPGGEFAGKEDVVAQTIATSETQSTCATGRIWVSQTPPTLADLRVGEAWQVSPRSWTWHLSSRGLPTASHEGTLR